MVKVVLAKPDERLARLVGLGDGAIHLRAAISLVFFAGSPERVRREEVPVLEP